MHVLRHFLTAFSGHRKYFLKCVTFPRRARPIDEKPLDAPMLLFMRLYGPPRMRSAFPHPLDKEVKNLDFQQIYETFFPLVYGFLLKQCGNAHLAEELTQDTFYRALKSIDSFKGDCRLETWLCQIAKNTYISECRRKKRLFPLPRAERTDPSAPDLSENLLTGESAMEVLKAAHLLDETSKEVFLLRTCGEQEFAAIGELFGKSANWARVTYHRAKVKVLKTIEEKEEK